MKFNAQAYVLRLSYVYALNLILSEQQGGANAAAAGHAAGAPAFESEFDRLARIGN